jgi:hypothetical protein
MSPSILKYGEKNNHTFETNGEQYKVDKKRVKWGVKEDLFGAL